MYGTLANTGAVSAGLMGTVLGTLWTGLAILTVMALLLTLTRLIPRQSM